MRRLMVDLLKLIWLAIVGLFRSRASLETEILALRHQLNVLRRKPPKRIAFTTFDRLVFASLSQSRYRGRMVRRKARLRNWDTPGAEPRECLAQISILAIGQRRT